jgi:hypothetical protein
MANRFFVRSPILMPALPFLALVACLAPEAAAQAPEELERTTLSGIVVDAASGTLIPGAKVIFVERAAPTISDAQGRFAFPDVQPGLRTLIVTQLGYDSLRTEVTFTGADDPVVVRMTPDPVELERITIVVDRLERRRRALGASARVFDRLTLQTSAAMSALDLVLTRTGIVPSPCPQRFAMTPCAFVRGRVIPVRVFIDGASIISGIDVLASLPPDELYVLEVIGGGSVIRAYTTWFMETVASGRRLPPQFVL